MVEVRKEVLVYTEIDGSSAVPLLVLTYTLVNNLSIHLLNIFLHIWWFYKVRDKDGFQEIQQSLKIWFQCRLSFNADQEYCRMLQREHSAILSTFIKLPFVIKIFVLSILHRFYCNKIKLTVIAKYFNNIIIFYVFTRCCGSIFDMFTFSTYW